MLNAQVSEQKRIEFDLKDGYGEEKVYTFGNKGFVISSRNEESNKGETEMRYELFNTELQSIKSKSIDIDRKYTFDQVFKSNTHIHTLYGRKLEYTLVSVDASDLSITDVSIKIPKKTSVWDMTILGDKAFFRTYSKKRDFLMSVDWKTGKTNFIPVIIGNYSGKSTRINSIQVLDKTNEVLVYVTILLKKGKTELYVVRFNSEGEKQETWHLTNKIEQNLIDLTGSNVGAGKYVFTGTFARKGTVSSEGVFFCQIDEGKLDFIRFYKYTELKEYFTYMGKRNQEKLEKKIAKKEKKGKELVITTRIANHEILQIGNEYFFLGEHYYPTYRTETYYTTQTVNGVTTTTARTRQVFDGFQYTHAILLKFDAKGELKWDRAFEMWPTTKPFYVKRFISAHVENNSSVDMVFINYNKIVSKSIDIDGTVLKDVQSDNIETGYSGDKSKYTFSNIDYWFDNYFLAFGSQVIKNKEDKSVQRKRKVFFVSRVGY